MVAIVEGLTRRFRVDALIERHDSTVVLGAFAFVNGCIAIGVLSVAQCDRIWPQRSVRSMFSR